MYPFVLGHSPSTADFGLLGPIYAHLYRDPVPGAILRRDYPLVCQWAVRCHEGTPPPQVQSIYRVSDLFSDLCTSICDVLPLYLGQ